MQVNKIFFDVKKVILKHSNLLKGRLSEELRTEQEHGLAADKSLKTLSAQSMELQSRLEDVETTALRHGRKIVAKLEERVRALESELCKFLFSKLPMLQLNLQLLHFREATAEKFVIMENGICFFLREMTHAARHMIHFFQFSFFQHSRHSTKICGCT